MLHELYQLMDKEKVKAFYVKIIALTFDEKPIREIQGSIASGSISVNGNSAVRRTINLSMLADEDTNKLTNLNNIISINKKVKIEVGYKNNFPKYKYLGEIIWFPCGIYIVEKVSLAKSTTGSTISITGKDKMAQLDGTIGGIIPASTTFHEREIQNEDGTIIKEYPTILQIIKESVNHFGKEPVNNIFINDLEEQSKMLVKYDGSTPIWFNNNYTQRIISETEPNKSGGPWTRYVKGQNIGYMMTDTTYPGELILEAGSTVVQLLDKINTTLGKTFEYFYDLDGRFIFQKIKNYQDESYTPIVNLDGDSYVKYFTDSKYHYAFTSGETQVSVNYNPKYENIKNDFIVWGQRETSAGSAKPIRYHLAIDEKPLLDLATKYMYSIESKDYGTVKYLYLDKNDQYNLAITEAKIEFQLNLDREYQNQLKQLQKDFKDNLISQEECESRTLEITEVYSVKSGEIRRFTEKLIDQIPSDDVLICKLIGEPSNDWREELYRQALETQLYGSTEAAGHYDEELIAEWRKLYDWFPVDPLNPNSEKVWGWNPLVYKDPGALDYWLDFIDSGSKLGEFSVNTIGRRTKVVKNDSLKTVYNSYYEDMLITTDHSYQNDGTIEKVFYITENEKTNFNISSTGTSCFDAVRELIYQHLVYNISADITCTPKYYLEPNTMIRIEDQDCGVYGDFVITQFNLPLNYSGTMSITANEALVRV